jgi:hypothetical protein
MAYLPSLSANIQELKSSYDSWNEWALWFTAGAAICATLAAVCAVGYFITSYQASKRSQALNAAVEEESRLKDEQREKEKQDSDRRIAEAEERTRELDLELAQQRERAAVEQQNLLAMKDRMFVQRGFTNWNESLKILASSPKGAVEIFCIPESKETLNFAQALADLLKISGWKVSGPQTSKTILPFAGVRLEVGARTIDEKNFPPLVSTLKKVLSLNEPIIVPNQNLPPGKLIFFVGSVI